MKLLVLLLLVSNCLSLKNYSIANKIYPSLPDEKGFEFGIGKVNQKYFKTWCNIHCEELKTELSKNENLYLEVKARMDATELPEASIKLSLERAESIKKELVRFGFQENRILAIPNRDTNKFIGKDKFDPINRSASFRFVEKN